MVSIPVLAAAMDTEGIDIAVLFPSRGLTVLAIDGMDPDLALAISQAYNNWLYEFCQGGPDRLYGAAMIPPFDVEYAVTETRRVTRNSHWRNSAEIPLAHAQRKSSPYSHKRGAR